jgi:hypothetical protein
MKKITKTWQCPGAGKHRTGRARPVKHAFCGCCGTSQKAAAAMLAKAAAPVSLPAMLFKSAPGPVPGSAEDIAINAAGGRAAVEWQAVYNDDPGERIRCRALLDGGTAT